MESCFNNKGDEMSRSKITKMGEVLLKRPKQQTPHSIFSGFREQLPIPNYEKLVFMDKEKEKEWEQLDESHKSFIMKNLRETAMLMESKIAIEMLCHIINELNERIKKLEAVNEQR